MAAGQYYAGALQEQAFYIPQRGVQWKQGVVIYVVLYTSLLYNATSIHCTPLPLHPPVMNTQQAFPPHGLYSAGEKMGKNGQVAGKQARA